MDASDRTPATPEHVGAVHHHLPVPPVADSRGLTASGAVALALCSGVFGGAIDVITGSGLRGAFAFFFALGCGAAAWKVHREDLVAAVVIPPLAYLALTAGAALFRRTTVGGSFLRQQVYELFDGLILGAPKLLLATACAAAVAVVRARVIQPEQERPPTPS
jgi:hypothetical protein